MVGGGKRGGEEEEETEGIRGREKEKPALIQSMGSIFAEGLGGKGGIRMRAGGAGSYDREEGEGGFRVLSWR